MPNETESQWDQAGWSTYAAIMLFGTGLVGILNGVWALRHDEIETTLVVAADDLLLWGLVALLGGLLLLATGIGAFYGKAWARWTGIVLSVLGIVWNVAWSEVQETQSLIGALLFASVVYALATTPVTVEMKAPARSD